MVRENQDIENENQDVEIERKEKKTDSSKVGVAAIKYLTYLIIFFSVLWFLIHYILPLF